MTPEQVTALGPAFAAYLRECEDCFGQDRARDHLKRFLGCCVCAVVKSGEWLKRERRVVWKKAGPADLEDAANLAV